MRKTKLAVTISSVLLGVAAAHAEPESGGTLQSAEAPATLQQAEPVSQQGQATPQTDTGRPSTTSTAPDADTATGTSSTGNVGSGEANPDVGTPRSNVDEKSSSGSYYPYSAGTAGDDPSYPKSTSVPTDAGQKSGEPTDQWMDPNADVDGDGYLSQDEVAKVAPALSPRFNEMDVDGDQKITKAEYRTWNESQKARMDADQGATASPGSQSSGTTSTDSTSTPGNTSATPAPSTRDLDSSTTPAADNSTSDR